MSRPVLLVAASGLAREALEAARASGAVEVVGCLDDDASRKGSSLLGVEVLGSIDDVVRFPDADLVLCAGKGATRAAIETRLTGLGVAPTRYATIVDRSVRVPASCSVGAGSIVLAGTVLTADVSLGRHVVVMPNAVFTHDDEVGDHATVCAGVVLGGSVVVGARAYLGMASSVRERLRVGADSVLGMGAVAVTDVPDGQVWAGVPARRMTAPGV